MTSISKINFTGDLLNSTSSLENKISKTSRTECVKEADAPVEKETVQREIVQASKNPDRAVDATGVIAGTSGMIGGAVLGGLIGISKLHGEIYKDPPGT